MTGAEHQSARYGRVGEARGTRFVWQVPEAEGSKTVCLDDERSQHATSASAVVRCSASSTFAHSRAFAPDASLTSSSLCRPLLEARDLTAVEPDL